MRRVTQVTAGPLFADDGPRGVGRSRRKRPADGRDDRAIIVIDP